jgi:hypothetical protein
MECQRRTGAVISNQARFRREQVTFAGTLRMGLVDDATAKRPCIPDAASRKGSLDLGNGDFFDARGCF